MGEGAIVPWTCNQFTAYEGDGLLHDSVTDQHHKLKDNDSCTLRIKAFGIAAVKGPFQLPFQILFRVVDLVCCNWFSRGIEDAKLAHYAAMGKDISLRGKEVSTLSKVYHCIKQLAISIAKVVLFPLAILARTLSCAITMILPYHGMSLIAAIDRMMYVRPLDIYKPSWLLEDLGQMVAPCMQTKEFNEAENRYREAPEKSYHEKATRTQLHKLNRVVSRLQLFSPRELEDGTTLLRSDRLQSICTLAKTYIMQQSNQRGRMVARQEAALWHENKVPATIREISEVTEKFTRAIEDLTQHVASGQETHLEEQPLANDLRRYITPTH